MSTSLFEIIGPVMVGPSSSHTAGMVRIGLLANHYCQITPQNIRLTLSHGMRQTYRGHRSDCALVAGILGLAADSPEVKNALTIARDRGITVLVNFFKEDEATPNNVHILLTDSQGNSRSIRAVSIGGGSVVVTQLDGKDVDIDPVWEYGATVSEEFTFDRFDKASAYCRENGLTLPQLAVMYECRRSGFSEEHIRDLMKKQIEVMRQSISKGVFEKNNMLYGLTPGDDGKRLYNCAVSGKALSGSRIMTAVAKAVGIMEHNASMGCIVAAPTAGSAGIIPGCLLTLQEEMGFDDDALIDALFVSGFAGVIMAHRNVSFSGSVGGCQGEIGVSSALAAVGLASICTEEPDVVFHAAAMCLKNLLGLVCDPIAGPIEVPCIKRNAIGVANAFVSADMALAGVKSYIPPDEVVDALIDIQNRMPKELKCTVTGGLACTETAHCLRRKLQKELEN